MSLTTLSNDPPQDSPLQANSPSGGASTYQMPAKCSGAGRMSRVEIYRVRYINILIWRRRDSDTKRTPPSIEICPENLGAMLDWFIKLGLLTEPIRCKKWTSIICIDFLLPLGSLWHFLRANNQTKEKETYCQEWDSNPRLHSETRTPAPIVCWEGD